MRIEVKKWSFNERDHLWLEDSSPTDYMFDDSCDGCGAKMIEISKVTNNRSESGLVTGLCQNCGYVKRLSNLSENWYSTHFAKRWLKGNNSKISDQQVLKEDLYVYDKITTHLPTDRKLSVLDAGCGIGQRLLPFNENGFNVFGFDPSEHRTEIASQMMGNIEISTAEEYLEQTSETFDVIYFFNVLQFVRNPFAVIRLASEKLAEGGILFFSVGQFFNDANYAHFAHLGVIRSFLSLYALKDLFKELDLWPLEYSESPLEIVLKKDTKANSHSDKILESAPKVIEKDIEKFLKRTLHLNRLKLFGTTTIKYQGREISLNKYQKTTNNLPVEFLHKGDQVPILLK